MTIVALEDNTGPLAQVQVWQRLHREWRAHLTVFERDVVSYILDNTINWRGRRWLEASLDQMVNGVQTDRFRLTPIGICRRKLVSVLARLCDLGIVSRRRAAGSDQRMRYTIDPSWRPSQCTPCTAPVHTVHQTSAPNALHRKDIEETAGSGKQDTPATRPAAVALLQKVRVGSAGADMDTVWRDAWAQAYPGQQPKFLGAAERGMMSKLRTRLQATRKGFDWFDFLTFVIVEWRPIRAKYFAWMSKAPPPELPDMRFLCADKFTGKFLEAYARKSEMAALDKATGEDRIYLRMIQNGASHDEAMQQIGASRANAANGEAHKAALSEAHAQARAFAIERDRLVQEKVIAVRNATKAASAVPAPVRAPLDHGDNLYATPHLFAIDEEPFAPFNEELPLAA